MKSYNAFSRRMQELIDNVIENAVEFSSDMLIDCNVQECTTLAQFRNIVLNQAIFFMSTEIDPDDAEIEVPQRLKDAIAERTKDQVRIIFNFQGA